MTAKLALTQEGPESIRLTIGSETIVFEGEALDELITKLGAARASTRKSLPPFPESDQFVITDPQWQGWIDPGTNGAFLSFLHRGFGWVFFHLPLNETTKIAEFLHGSFRVLPPETTAKH